MDGKIARILQRGAPSNNAASFRDRFGRKVVAAETKAQDGVAASAASAAAFLSQEEENALKISPMSDAEPATTEAEALREYPMVNLEPETEKATKNLLLENWGKLRDSKETSVQARQDAIAQSAAAIMNITYRNYLLQKEHNAKDKEGEQAGYAGETYNDEASRNMLFGMMDAATSTSAIAMSVGALSNLACGLKGEALKELQFERFGAKIIGAFKDNKANSSDVRSLARGISNLVYENEEQRSLIAKDGEVVQKLLSKMGDKSLTDGARGASLVCLQNLFFNKEQMKEVGFDTKENLDKIFAAAKNLTDERGRGGALNMIKTMAEAHPEFLQGRENELKEMMVDWSKTAQDPWLIKNISAGFLQFSKLQTEGVSLQDFDTKDTLFEMGRNAKGPEAIAAVAFAISNVAWEINKKREGLSGEALANFDEIYGGEDTHAFFQEMMGRVDKLGSKEGDKARGAVASAIASVCLGDKAAARFCNEDTKKTMLDWGRRAKTDEGIAGVAAAISSMARYEGRVLEQNRANVFANDPQVKDALASMKERLGGVLHTDKFSQERADGQIDLAQKNVALTNEKAKSSSWVAKVQQESSGVRAVDGSGVAPIH